MTLFQTPNEVDGSKPNLLQTFEEVTVAKPTEEDQRLWSVTTIISVLDKPALIWWSAEETAKAAIAIRRSIAQRVEEEGEESVIDWLQRARFRRPRGQRTAAELGTAFHEVAEHIAIYGKRPPNIDAELVPFVNQLEDWLARAQPTFEAAEMPLYSTNFSHAGTMDGIMVLDGLRCCLDWKTSRKSFDKKQKKTGPYPEVALQLAAYRHSEWAVPVPPRRWSQHGRRYYLFGDVERDNAITMPETDAGIVVHVTPEHCDGYFVNCDESIYERFLFILEAAKFPFEIAKTVIGDELEFEEV